MLNKHCISNTINLFFRQTNVFIKSDVYIKNTSTMFKKILLTSSLFLLVSSLLFGQVQSGNTLYGQNGFGSYYGWTVSMGNATTMAVGSPDDGSGIVRVYTWVNNAWQQKGLNISDVTGGKFGSSVSMANANTLAISCKFTGEVQIYEWVNTAWQQKGAAIPGGVGEENSCVSMPDINTVAIGNPSWSSPGGNTRVYEWVNNAWQQKGQTLLAEGNNDNAGCSVSMPDANTIAIGANRNAGSLVATGHVRIYEWLGNTWVQKGLDIDGASNSEEFGRAVSMADSNTITIGAPGDNPSNRNGLVRVYEWTSNAWVQKGVDISGAVTGMELGAAVSMPDANTFAVGAPYGTDNNLFNGVKTGKVRVYEWVNNAWSQKGMDMNGDAGNDQFGFSVSMPDANTVAGGGHYGDSIPVSALGYVKVYGFGAPLSAASYSLENQSLGIYPNPTTDYFQIDIQSPDKVLVLNTIGEMVLATQSSKINLSSLSSGLYFIKVKKGDRNYLGQVVKK